MLKIGITGGIGSGKTTACKFFEELGVSVFYSDTVAKIILDLPETVQQIQSVFGEEILKDQLINTKKLASIIFTNPKKRDLLNSIIHPKVATAYLEWLKKHESDKYTLKEAAILFETGTFKELDKTILIVADKNIRIDRILKRDNSTKEEILARMKNQWSDAKKIPLADFIVKNNTITELKKQIFQIHQQLIAL